MRFLTTISLSVLLVAPFSYAQQPAPLVSAPCSSPPHETVTASSSPHTASRSLPPPRVGRSVEPIRRLDSNRPDSSRPAHTGRIPPDNRGHLGGGTFAGIGAYKLFRNSGDTEWAALNTSLGIVLLAGGVSLIGTGIHMTIRGVRILQGDASPAGWGPQSPPPLPPPGQSSSSSLTVSL